VAYHPKQGIHGLRPDIFHPFAPTSLSFDMVQPLSFWGNHKVVAHNGIYYDPSYRRIYADLNDMAAFRMTAKRDLEVYVAEVVCSNLTRRWLAGQTMYFRSLVTPEFIGWKGPYRAIA
jgi:hypothetical protein